MGIWYDDYWADEVSLSLKYWHETLGKSKIAALLPNDDTGKSILDALQQEANKENVTVIPEFFSPGDNDYTANITAARRANPDFYYAYSNVTPDLGRIVKQMRQLGIPATSISVNNYVSNNDFLALLSPQEAEGLYGANSSYLNKDDAKVQDWLKRFKEKTGNDGDSVSLMVYDEAMVIFNAVEKAGTDSKKILEALHSTQYTGLSGGTIKFDSKGRGRRDTNIFQVGPDKKVKRLENVKEAGY